MMHDRPRSTHGLETNDSHDVEQLAASRRSSQCSDPARQPGPDDHLRHSSRAATTSGTSYYIDCHAGVNGDGTQAHPWNSLNPVNDHGDFGPGDKILLKRAYTCKGARPGKGSGSGGPHRVGAYGSSES